ncbi:hypothetical protein [Lewinella sp. W8]|uniref:hypothetical protein n=1 Tax=Lewinella sp. W8 TaxID=2528208 RepID=UPI0010673397|nr:hypothetical protein [Lewinella sp. W8]MTB51230.1 hypothetical protein [Lewinella sp. W8]
MSKKTTMQLLLEARFQQLAEDHEERHEMPAELREEVFRTLDLIDVVGEVTDLFTGKFGETTVGFIDLIESPDLEGDDEAV